MILSLGPRVMRWGDCDVSGGAVPRPAKDKVGEGDDVDEGSDAPRPGAPRRRNWSDEEKAWIVQESLERGTTVEEVAERHGVPSRRLSYWRKLARKGQLVVPAARSESDGTATGSWRGRASFRVYPSGRRILERLRAPSYPSEARDRSEGPTQCGASVPVPGLRKRAVYQIIRHAMPAPISPAVRV